MEGERQTARLGSGGLGTAQMNPSSSAWAALEVRTRLILRSGSSNLGTLNFNKTAAENAHKAFFQRAEQTTDFLFPPLEGGKQHPRKIKEKKKDERREANCENYCVVRNFY